MAKKMNKHQKRVANDIMTAMKTAGISWKEPLVTAGISWKEPLVFLVGDGIFSIVPEDAMPFPTGCEHCCERNDEDE